MRHMNVCPRTPEEARALLQRSEAEFESRLNALVHAAVYDGTPEVITLSGPTCSGKTTTARKLTAEIAAAGKCAVVLSIDDFFYDRSALSVAGTDGDVDFDSVAAIDLAELSACLSTMLRGERTVLPRYDFVTGTRAESYVYESTPEDIIILEGIQAVYPEVTALLAGYPHAGIFICVNEDVMVNGVSFSAHDIRLCRRIVRDHLFRSASPEFTFAIWPNVRGNEERNIFPNVADTMYRIDSFLSYELFMLRPHLLPLLDTIRVDSRHFAAAQTLREKLCAIGGIDIPASELSAASLYHEFLG